MGLEKKKTFEELRKEHEEFRMEVKKYADTIKIPDSPNSDQYDMCVSCGRPTPYPKNLDISKRHCYVEGSGQLCVECCKQVNDKR